MDCILTVWTSSSFWEGVEYFSEAIVITAALVEFLCDFEHIMKGDDKREMRRRVEKWSATVLVIGLGIELGSLVRTNQLFDAEIRETNNRAIEAIQRANREAGARLVLEKQLVAMGPRYILFAGANGKRFRDALRPFAGQRINLRTASRSLDNSEIQTLKTLLFAVLSSSSPSSPKWNATLSEQSFVSPEVMIGRSDRAAERTKSAATTLARALGNIGLSDVTGKIPPPVEVFSRGDANVGTKPAPDTVWLLIGAHMLIDTKALEGTQP